jgi:translation initiation factor 2-alpha kinase 3
LTTSSIGGYESDSESSSSDSELNSELNAASISTQFNSTSECDDALVWDAANSVQRRQDEEDRVRKEEERRHVYLYIVMQLCQKESLRDWLRSCTVQRARKRSILMFREICLGVEYVHAQGLIHRDLKPSNIFFSNEGTIKIGDFGLVTAYCDASDNNLTAAAAVQDGAAGDMAPSPR